jgi:hypothetical protein
MDAIFGRSKTEVGSSQWQSCKLSAFPSAYVARTLEPRLALKSGGFPGICSVPNSKASMRARKLSAYELTAPYFGIRVAAAVGAIQTR